MSNTPPESGKWSRRFNTATAAIKMATYILVAFFVGSVLFRGKAEKTAGFSDAKENVAIIKLHGVIGTGKNNISFDAYRPIIDEAFNAPFLKAVYLDINSPGGSALESVKISTYIRQQADEHLVPVVTYVDGMAASGGYMLAVAADKIYAPAGSIIGHIGVIMDMGFDLHNLTDAVGVKPRIISVGRNKTVGNPFLPMSDDERQHLQNMANAEYKRFVGWVKTQRGYRLNGPDSELFEANIWDGTRAKELGIIDDIGMLYQEEIRLEKSGVNVVTLAPEPHRGLADLLNGELNLSDLAEEITLGALNGLKTFQARSLMQ